MSHVFHNVYIYLIFRMTNVMIFFQLFKASKAEKESIISLDDFCLYLKQLTQNFKCQMLLIKPQLTYPISYKQGV